MHAKLRALREVLAPPDFVPNVMRAAGLLDSYAILESALGPVFVSWNERGVSSLARSNEPSEFERGFRERFHRGVEATQTVPPALRRAVAGGAGNEARSLDYDLRSITTFQAAVLRKTLEIPRGEVRAYGWIARELGNPGAVRAVGSALRNNPIPLLLPCHRVVRGDGTLGHYALGDAEKPRLLRFEGVDPALLAR